MENKAKTLFFEDINAKQIYGKINWGRGRKAQYSIFLRNKKGETTESAEIWNNEYISLILLCQYICKLN